MKKMPALLTSTSIEWKRDSAVSTILVAVAGSPMWPSTRATSLEAATSVDWVIFRELATTLKPRSTKAFTMPAPIPCEAPVTMTVFRWLLMVAYLENVLSLGPNDQLRGRSDRELGSDRRGPPVGCSAWILMKVLVCDDEGGPQPPPLAAPLLGGLQALLHP